jgi:hypothetical protein
MSIMAVDSFNQSGRPTKMTSVTCAYTQAMYSISTKKPG